MTDKPVRLRGYCACGAIFEAVLQKHVRGQPGHPGAVQVMGEPVGYAERFRALHTGPGCRPCTREEAEKENDALWHRLHDPQQVALPLDNP